MAKKSPTPLKEETRKIFGLFALIFLLVLVVGGGIFYFTEYRFMNNKFADDGKIALVFVELLGIEDIIVEDEEVLGELLKKIAVSNENIQSIRIENESGRELATWVHPNPSPTEEQSRYDKDVFVQGEKFGRVIVNFDFYATSLRVKHHLQILSVIFSVIMLVAALFFYYFTRKLLIKPMRSLYHYMDKKVQGADANLAIPSSPFYSLFELASRLGEPSASTEEVQNPMQESVTPAPPAEVTVSSIDVAPAPEKESPVKPVEEAKKPSAESAAPAEEVVPVVAKVPAETLAATPVEAPPMTEPEAIPTSSESTQPDPVAETSQTEKSETPPATESPEVVEPAEAKSISKEIVLVVDDEELTRKRIQNALGESYECLFAEECDAGLELFKQNAEIKLVILPLVILEMMGDTDRVFEGFRTANPEVHIIFTTASFATMPIPAKLAAAPLVVFIEKGTEAESIPEKIQILSAA